MKHIIPILIVLLLLSSGFVGVSYSIDDIEQSIMPILYNGNILYVGGNGTGNYSKIQDAIDNASDGDTIYVYDDSSPYYENLVVNKSIKLIGEDKNTTVIDGEKKDDVVIISVDKVTIIGFTIQNSSFEWVHYKPPIYTGVRVTSNENIIMSNIITSNFFGLILDCSSNNTISDNVFEYNYHLHAVVASALSIINLSHNNDISENTITNNEAGCHIGYYSSNNVITKNTFADNDYGISLSFRCSENTISKNKIYNNRYEEIEVEYESCNNTIYRNIIKMGSIGLYHSSNSNIISGNIVTQINIYGSHFNKIYRNIIFGYFGDTARDFGNNSWDNGKVGNYWGNYRDYYPDARRSFPRFWVWDTPYEMIYPYGNVIDRYPIVGSWITFLLLIEEILNILGVM